MKHILILSIAAFCFVTTSCGQNKSTSQNSATADSLDVKAVSYALGVDVAQSIKQINIENLDQKKFAEGFEKAYKSSEGIDLNANRMVIQNYLQAMQVKKANDNKQKGKEFLEKNAKEQGVVTTESGLQYKIEQEGTGAYPADTSEVEVNYRGTLLDGREFDSSYSRNETAKFPLNRVIKGWTEGIQKVKEGGKIKLFIPSDLAYGDNGARGTIIEPGSTLIFEVELIKIVK